MRKLFKLKNEKTLPWHQLKTYYLFVLTLNLANTHNLYGKVFKSSNFVSYYYNIQSTGRGGKLHKKEIEQRD